MYSIRETYGIMKSKKHEGKEKSSRRRPSISVLAMPRWKALRKRCTARTVALASRATENPRAGCNGNVPVQR
jgi:hypothetical protein